MYKNFILVFGLFLAEIIITNRINIAETNTNGIDMMHFFAEQLSINHTIETHHVKTTDGFLLTMHRIPFSPKNPNNTKKPIPIFLQHGLAFSSFGWILNGPELSLPIVLSDAGFDVWMGNIRGTSYSNHSHLDYNSEEFWDFSWHEMGLYDLPAMIDYVLNYTKMDKLHYIGSSQGTTAFFVMTSELPSYNDKILSMHALTPVAFITNPQHPLVPFLSPIFSYPSELMESHSKQPFYKFLNLITRSFSILCRTISDRFCSVFLHNFFGYNGDNIDPAITANILEHVPQGASVKCLTHYLQLFKSRKFRQYDYGQENSNIYGTIDPPEYDLSKITCPVFLYYAKNDLLTSYIDVARFSLTLPKETVHLNYSVPDQYNYNHIDFIFAKNAKTLIFDQMMDSMRSIEQKQQTL